MHKLIVLATALALLATPAIARPLSDAEVRQALIQASIASYPGSCPCPFSVDRAGHACGRRSAYSKPGGYSPVCYASDVTALTVREFRARGVGP